MQVEVLPHGELRVQRERLRHEPDTLPRDEVTGVHGLAQQPGLALGHRQQPGQHLHRGGLAAAVRSEKAEDLAAADAEAHPVHRDEVAEPPGQILCFDRDLVVCADPRRNHERGMMVALGCRKQADESLLQRARIRAGLERCRRVEGQDLSRIHRDQPVEALGLVEVGSGHQDAHSGAGARGCGRSAPRTACGTADPLRWSARPG